MAYIICDICEQEWTNASDHQHGYKGSFQGQGKPIEVPPSRVHIDQAGRKWLVIDERTPKIGEHYVSRVTGAVHKQRDRWPSAWTEFGARKIVQPIPINSGGYDAEELRARVARTCPACEGVPRWQSGFCTLCGGAQMVPKSVAVAYLVKELEDAQRKVDATVERLRVTIFG